MKTPARRLSVAVQAGVGHGSGSSLEHEELLGEHLLHFPRRDAELLGGYCQFVQVITFERRLVQPFTPEPGAFFRPPPVPGRGGFDGLVSPQHPLLEGAERLPGAEAGVHADHCYRRPVLRFRFVLSANGPVFGLRQPFLDQEVGIDAAEAEGADCGAARNAVAAALPRLRRCQDPERAVVQIDCRLRSGKIGGRRECPFAHGEQDLGERGSAGSGEEVADVRLDRADDTARLLTAGCAPQSSRRLATSVASPTGVPVAWHSIRSTSRGFQPLWA